MSKYFKITFVLLLLFSVTSCSKKVDAPETIAKEDPNNYFIATFNGKTLKTSGFIVTTGSNTDNITYSLTFLSSSIQTRNTGTGVESVCSFTVMGSIINALYGTTLKLPVQPIDAKFDFFKTGNAVGTYRIEDYGAGILTSSITDLAAGNKKYDIDPATTTVTITAVDALFLQGTFTGRLIDGVTKIPVSGSFKIRK